MISSRQIDILSALAVYGYLTAPQILKLGTYSDKASLYAALASLDRLGLIAGTAPQAMPGAGRFPGVYALTTRGAEEIGAALETVVKPLRGAKSSAPPLDVAHRTAIVDCHIALRSWSEAAGHRVAWFVPDFAPSAQAGRRATAIRTEYGDYAPDALAVLDCADGIRRPLVLEVYRGGITDRPGYMLGKLPDVLRAVTTAAVKDALGSQIGCQVSAVRLLVVTASEKLRDSALTRPPAPELPGWAYTFLKSLGEVEADFGDGWWRLSRTQEPLFSAKVPNAIRSQ
jgi:DNA-binding PadR family transcriptional regulator